MSNNSLAVYRSHSEILFEYGTAARLARVNEEFICCCEREELVVPRLMIHGKKGLCAEDVFKLKMIRHLHEDMGVDLEAVDLILRYHNRINQLRLRLEEMEQQFRRKEQEHLSEIMALEKRLAKMLDAG